MNLTTPFSFNTISQKFGDNAVSQYLNMGLVGHPGIDYVVSWGISVSCAVDSYCYSITPNSDPAFYNAVYTIYDDGKDIYEISYGHLSSINVVAGVTIRQGDIIGRVGNTGTVFSSGKEVTETDKLNGSHAGSHLHFQVRQLKKVLASVPFDPLKHYVNDGHGQLEIAGYNYYVLNYSNGYSGCIDPSQFFSNPQSPEKPLETVVPSDDMTNTKRYLLSSFTTFISTALVVLGGQLISGDIQWTASFIFGMLLIAVRAGVKAVVEAATK